MYTKLHNSKRQRLEKEKTLILVHWDKVTAGTQDTKSCGSLSYFLQEISYFFPAIQKYGNSHEREFEVLNYYYYYYYYYIFCQRLFLLGLSLEPTVITTAQATIFRL